MNDLFEINCSSSHYRYFIVNSKIHSKYRGNYCSHFPFSDIDYSNNFNTEKENNGNQYHNSDHYENDGKNQAYDPKNYDGYLQYHASIGNNNNNNNNSDTYDINDNTRNIKNSQYIKHNDRDNGLPVTPTSD